MWNYSKGIVHPKITFLSSYVPWRHFKDCFPFNYKVHIAFKFKKQCKNTIKGGHDFVVHGKSHSHKYVSQENSISVFLLQNSMLNSLLLTVFLSYYSSRCQLPLGLYNDFDFWNFSMFLTWSFHMLQKTWHIVHKLKRLLLWYFQVRLHFFFFLA